MKKIIVICKYCKKEFPVESNKNRKFCSKKCNSSWRSKNYSGKNSPSWKGKKIKKCEYCTKDFAVYQYRKNVARFCSHKCYSMWLSDNITGKQHRNWVEKIKVKCKQCKIIFGRYPYENNREFCSRKCFDIWRSENKTSCGRNKEVKPKKYKIWRKSVFERDNYRCLICGEVGGVLNAHHIKNWKYFPEYRYDVDNGMTMCEDCHHIVNKELPLFSIKKQKRKVL